MDFDGGLNFDATKPDGAARKLTDFLLLSRMGWQCRVNLQERLKATYNWYLDQDVK